MAVYTYDEEADALYVLLSVDADPSIERTVELGEHLNADLDGEGRLVGVEILYPRLGPVDLRPILERFGVELRLPFTFAA